jgi:hypothetical protein
VFRRTAILRSYHGGAHVSAKPAGDRSGHYPLGQYVPRRRHALYRIGARKWNREVTQPTRALSQLE